MALPAGFKVPVGIFYSENSVQKFISCIVIFPLDYVSNETSYTYALKKFDKTIHLLF